MGGGGTVSKTVWYLMFTTVILLFSAMSQEKVFLIVTQEPCYIYL